MPIANPTSRMCALALLATAAASLAGCQPSKNAKPEPTSATTQPAPIQPTEKAAPPTIVEDTTDEAGLKGLDPSPVLSRTDMGNGLIIEDLKMGTGDIVWPNGRVRLNIKGWSVATGKVYWDTAALDGPKDIVLSTAMKGMREGVPGMRIGGKRRLSIPADKAYGFKEVKDDKGELVVPQATPIVLEIEAVQALTSVKLPPADGSAEPANNSASPQ